MYPCDFVHPHPQVYISGKLLGKWYNYCIHLGVIVLTKCIIQIARGIDMGNNSLKILSIVKQGVGNEPKIVYELSNNLSVS